MSNFQSLEVVDRRSETQPQVVEKIQKYVSRIRVNPLTAKLFNLNLHPLEKMKTRIYAAPAGKGLMY